MLAASAARVCDRVCWDGGELRVCRDASGAAGVVLSKSALKPHPYNRSAQHTHARYAHKLKMIDSRFTFLLLSLSPHSQHHNAPLSASLTLSLSRCRLVPRHRARRRITIIRAAARRVKHGRPRRRQALACGCGRFGHCWRIPCRLIRLLVEVIKRAACWVLELTPSRRQKVALHRFTADAATDDRTAAGTGLPACTGSSHPHQRPSAARVL